jgi:hypothetical protein
MMKIQQAVESIWALVLARFVMPALLSFALGVGTWYAHRIEALFEQVVDLRLDQRETSVRVSEIERRLNARQADPTTWSQHK